MHPPWRPKHAPVVALAALAFVAIAALRFAIRDANEPIAFLFVIPIGLVAAELGLKGGLLAAGSASAFLIVWDIAADPELTSLGFSLRFMVFFASGVTVGMLTQSRRDLEGETERWFDQSIDLNCVADLEGRFLRVNVAFSQLLGYKLAEVVGTPYISYVHPDDVEATSAVSAQLSDGEKRISGFENRYRSADGSYRWLRWSTTSDVNRGRVYASARDVTETKELESELRELALRDPLTGLFNRRAFEAEGTRQIDFLRRYGPGGAIMVFDIDDFKSINDSLGHTAGDKALTGIAAVIQQRIRASDTCARLGGDEFAILFPGVGAKEAELLANGLLGSIREQTVAGDGRGFGVSSSVGIAMFSQSADDLEALLALADKAMYDAKRAGGDRYAFAAAGVPHQTTVPSGFSSESARPRRWSPPT